MKNPVSLMPGGGKKRMPGIDLVRSLAIFCVIAGHFFSLNTPFRQTVFDGSFSMILQGMAYFLFGIGVLLFIMMTGFLNVNKQSFDKKYVKGMMKVLLAYCFFSIITFVFKRYYLHESLGCTELVKGTLDFSLIPYAWYIEMWIGLYLLTPFLNVGYNSLIDKSKKKPLIAVLFIMTAVPIFTNRYGLYVMPEFWVGLYPILFFVIGRYIREYTPVIRWWILLMIVVLICMINPLFSTLIIKGRTMMYIAGEPWSIFGSVIAVCMFLLIYRNEINNYIINRFISRIAVLSLDIYLCCYIADKLVYPFFIDRYYENQPQFGIWFFVIVPLILLISAVIAQLKRWLFKISRLDRI